MRFQFVLLPHKQSSANIILCYTASRINYLWTQCFKICENISTDGEVMSKIIVASWLLFFWDTVYYCQQRKYVHDNLWQNFPRYTDQTRLPLDLYKLRKSTSIPEPLSSSWREAFSRSLLPLQSSARTVYPPPAAGPPSLWHPCVSWQIWWIQVVGGRPQACLHSCDGRSPSLTLVQILRIWLAGMVCESLATWPNRPSLHFWTMNETSSRPVRWRTSSLESHASWCVRTPS